MASIISDIERTIYSKYINEELEIESKLRQLTLHPNKRDELQVQKLEKEREKKYFKALKRNKDILKNVELTVARIRSRSLYSPTDGHLEDTKARYIRKLKELREIDSAKEINTIVQ